MSSLLMILYFQRAEASHDRLKVLNPLVKLETIKKRLVELTDNFLSYFDLVILVDQSFDTIKSINNLCRAKNIRFIAGGVYGWTGYAFFDFDGYEFLMYACFGIP